MRRIKFSHFLCYFTKNRFRNFRSKIFDASQALKYATEILYVSLEYISLLCRSERLTSTHTYKNVCCYDEGRATFGRGALVKARS